MCANKTIDRSGMGFLSSNSLGACSYGGPIRLHLQLSANRGLWSVTGFVVSYAQMSQLYLSRLAIYEYTRIFVLLICSTRHDSDNVGKLVLEVAFDGYSLRLACQSWRYQLAATLRKYRATLPLSSRMTGYDCQIVRTGDFLDLLHVTTKAASIPSPVTM